MRIHPDHDALVALTAAWDGDRFDTGRPRVPDDVLERLRSANAETAWLVLLEAGYPRQFAGGWQQTAAGRVLVGRAVTATFLPHRPDLDAAVVRAGAQEGHTAGDRQNTWVVESLVEGDVMVADIFGKVEGGTVVGDNLGTAVAARTRRGAVIHGGVRDLHGLVELDAAFFHRGAHPTAIEDVTLGGIDVPVRVDGVTVLPGDVVLGTDTGVTFVPPHLAARVADAVEATQLRDDFGKQRLAAGTYTTADIDVPVWDPAIQADFEAWRAGRRVDGGER